MKKDSGFVNFHIPTIVGVSLFHFPRIDNRKVIRIKQLFMGEGIGRTLNNMNRKNSHYQTKPKLLGQVKRVMRTRNYSPRTIQTYVQWIKRFVLFHHMTHPSQMGKKEIGDFLTYLAVEGNVSPSIQNQALQAILFLFRDVLEEPVGWIDTIKRPH